MNPELELRATLRHIAALCDMGLMDPGVDVVGHALREKLGQVRAVALAALIADTGDRGMGKMREPRLRDDEGGEIDLETGEKREAPPDPKKARELIDMLRCGEGWRIGRDAADEGDW